MLHVRSIFRRTRTVRFREVRTVRVPEDRTAPYFTSTRSLVRAWYGQGRKTIPYDMSTVR